MSVIAHQWKQVYLDGFQESTVFFEEKNHVKNRFLSIKKVK